MYLSSGRLLRYLGAILSLRILGLVQERSDVDFVFVFLFVELKQYLSGGARLNDLPVRAVQRS